SNSAVIASQVLRNSNVSTLSWTATSALSPGHTYKWFVGAVSNNGTTFWNSGLVFSITPLAAPTAISPSGHISNDTPTFTWNAVSGANHYDVWVNEVNPSNTSQVIATMVLRNANVTTTSWTASSALSPGHWYKWYVGTVSTNGTTTWNSGTVFNIAPVAAPVGSSPSGPGITFPGDVPTFTWSNVAAADHYDVWVNEVNPANTSQVIASMVLRNATVAQSPTPSWTAMGSPLTPGHSYTWYVATVTSNGSTTWNSGVNFTMAPLAAPTATSPTSGQMTNDLPTFGWTSVSGADHYDVWVNELNPANTNQVLVSQVLRNASVSGTSWTTTTPLSPGHTYKWYVGSV